MNYNIEPIFVMFPLICLFFHITNIKTSKWLHFILIVSFILIYPFSLNGSDIDGYRQHYTMVEYGASVEDNAQEIGYYYLMKLAVNLGWDYLTFRVILLSTLAIVLFYSIRKLTDDLPLSMFFISTMFVIYTISAYRQFIVIAFSIWWLYQYGCGRKLKAIIGTSLLLLFHVTAILPLGCMVYKWYSTKSRLEKSTNRFKRYFTIIIFSTIIIRIAMNFLLETGIVNAIMRNVLGAHASPDPTLFSFGLISRMFFLFFITYLYRASGTEDGMIRLLFWYYFVSITLYIAVPLEFFMGRLMNNANILSAALIPMLRKDIVYGNRLHDVRVKGKTVILITVILEVLALTILINQLANQNGYTPYLNLLFGDSIVVFPIIKP